MFSRTKMKHSNILRGCLMILVIVRRYFFLFLSQICSRPMQIHSRWIQISQRQQRSKNPFSYTDDNRRKNTFRRYIFYISNFAYMNCLIYLGVSTYVVFFAPFFFLLPLVLDAYVKTILGSLSSPLASRKFSNKHQNSSPNIKSKSSGLVNVFLPLVHWWWWCCCLFLCQWTRVKRSTTPVVVAAAAAAVAAVDDEDCVQWRWWRGRSMAAAALDGIWRRRHLTVMAFHGNGVQRQWHSTKARRRQGKDGVWHQRRWVALAGANYCYDVKMTVWR